MTSSSLAGDAKLADMTAKMAAREADIRRRLDELRVARAEGKSEAERYTAFEAAFEAERLAIVAELDALDEAAGNAGIGGAIVELNNRLAAVNDRIACLQRYHSDSVAFLPVFVSASAKTKVEELGGRLATVRDRLVPKKKFVFSSKGSGTAASAKQPKPQQQQHQPQQPALQPTLHDLKGGDVTLEAGAIEAKDVLLSSLTDCTVRLLSHPATVHLHNLTNCTIICGPVHRSALIERCTGCNLVLACHQLRLHSSTDCRLYLHVASTPIIEDCSGISMAPYALRYPTLSDDVTASGLNWERNLWDRIQDFYHLAGHVASPNWSILPEAERRLWSE